MSDAKSDAALVFSRFTTWLPGELEYSREKVPYPDQIRQAALPLSDRGSMYGLLGAEWDSYNSLIDEGNLHASNRGMRVQLQLAKFAAGIFDKALVLESLLPYVKSLTIDGSDQFRQIRNSLRIMGSRYREYGYDVSPETIGDQTGTFENTFGPGVIDMMSNIRAAAEGFGERNEGTILDYEAQTQRNLKDSESVRALGMDAMGLYLDFTVIHLNNDQLILPTSEHA